MISACADGSRLGGVVVDDDHLLAALGGNAQRLERGGAKSSVTTSRHPAFARSAPALQGSARSPRAAGRERQPSRPRRSREIAVQQRRRGRAVDVVVGEDADPLAGGDRVRQPLDRDIEIEKVRGVGQAVADPRPQEDRRRVETDAARRQHAPYDLRQIETLADGQRKRLVDRPKLPAPAAERAIDEGGSPSGQRGQARAAQAEKCGTTALLRCR